MRPPETFLGQPIRDLQTMLRVIAKSQSRVSPIIPDGIYGPGTALAVREFQQEHGLPVTGITDQVTWEALLAAYIPAQVNLTPAQPLQILLSANQVIRKGERHAHVYLVQGMLAVLSDRYGAIPRPSFSGILDGDTEASISAFQLLCRLPATGALDKITWKYLALQYPLAANLDNLPDLKGNP